MCFAIVLIHLITFNCIYLVHTDYQYKSEGNILYLQIRDKRKHIFFILKHEHTHTHITV